MTLKSIEMQVALPRTQDAGQLQSQQLQKHVHDQALSAQETIRKKNELQNKSDKTNTEQHVKNEDQPQRDGQNKDFHGSQKHKAEENQAEHPYKGKRIDLSL